MKFEWLPETPLERERLRVDEGLMGWIYPGWTVEKWDFEWARGFVLTVFGERVSEQFATREEVKAYAEVCYRLRVRPWNT